MVRIQWQNQYLGHWVGGRALELHESKDKNEALPHPIFSEIMDNNWGLKVPKG